jgi:acetate kinase
MSAAILTLNAGSSSIKFSLFEVAEGARLHMVCRGEVEGIGSAPHFIVRDQAGQAVAEQSWPHADADPERAFTTMLETVIGWARSHLGADTLRAVGHRVVHGGPDHHRPARVTPDLLADLDRLVPMAPLHEPHNLAPIRAIAASRPGLPQVVCFDTAFHHDMPPVAKRFALPREYEASGVRRYGFHGLSYEYIAGRLRMVDPGLAGGRVIVAHLGNGASLCAMRDGRSVDTTMGFTALDGLVMGTRCGAIDPGVILYLQAERGMTTQAVSDLLNRRSGLLGVSGGLSSDMRVLLASGETFAQEAVELFVYRVALEVGALASALGGLDGLVFTAGIGEHAPEIRALVAARLGWLGVAVDPEANARGAAVISPAGGGVQVRVIPTDEDAMIARHTVDTIGADAVGGRALPVTR